MSKHQDHVCPAHLLPGECLVCLERKAKEKLHAGIKQRTKHLTAPKPPTEVELLRAENARLREALREKVIVVFWESELGETYLICEHCASKAWKKGDPESHAPSCLAAEKGNDNG